MKLGIPFKEFYLKRTYLKILQLPKINESNRRY